MEKETAGRYYRGKSNNTIWNLTSRTLPKDEYQALRYGLNHGLATHQKYTYILANAELISYQINKSDVC